MQHRILQIYIRMSLNLNHTNATTNNSIPYNIEDLRNKPKDSDAKIRNFPQQFDPSYSYNNNATINREIINNGIINIIAKTYPIKNN